MKSLKETKQFLGETVMQAQVESASRSEEIGKVVNGKVGRRVLSVLMVLTMMFCMATPAFAAGDTIFDSVGSFAETLKDKLVSISAVLAVLAVLFCAFMYMFGGQRTVENAKAWGLRILVALFVIGSATIIVSTVQNLSGGTL